MRAGRPAPPRGSACRRRATRSSRAARARPRSARPRGAGSASASRAPGHAMRGRRHGPRAPRGRCPPAARRPPRRSCGWSPGRRSARSGRPRRRATRRRSRAWSAGRRSRAGPRSARPSPAGGGAERAGSAAPRTRPDSAGAGRPPFLGSACTTSFSGGRSEVAPPSTSRTPCMRAASSAASVSSVCSRTISSDSPLAASVRMSSAVTMCFTHADRSFRPAGRR